MFSRIMGVGSYLPQKILTNQEIAQFVDTTDEWIFSRTGIKERHIRASDEAVSDLALKAALCAIENANITAQDIDLIIVATTTPDQIFPSTACILQDKLGLHGFAAFDVQAVCSGFIFALATADMYVKNGMAKCALVVGADAMSDLINWQDRGTCVLFGDGAGAVILQPNEQAGILSSQLKSDGRFRHILQVKAGVREGKLSSDSYLYMEGSAVFRFAVKALAEIAQSILKENHLEQKALDWFIPHQANIRIIESVAQTLKLPMEKVITTVDHHGNTSAASVPLALAEACKDGRIQKEDMLLLQGVGAGFSWGATLLRF